MRARLVLLLLACVAVGFGQYTWDYAKNPVISDTTRWSTNGSPTYGSYGVNFSGSGGSLISIPAISGTNSGDYEETSTLALNGGGGTYIHFLHTSGGTVQSGSGGYFSVELVVPSGFTSPGTATLNINKGAAGTVYLQGSTSVTATNGMTLRTIVFGGNLWVFVNNLQVWTGLAIGTTGNPGIGGYGMPAGSGFQSIELGHHDTVAPGQVIQTSVSSALGATQVLLKWQGVLDDANGIGLYEYVIARNGTAFSTTTEPTLVDNGVTASTTYTYTIQAMDFHGNLSTGATVTATTPPSGAINPRRVGLPSYGSYWGGGGEQIDTLSGNVNFSLPLLTAQGRTGWTVPVGLVYNSQNWLQDTGVNWKLGDDVGFGFGWQMLIGSLTPYQGNWTEPTTFYWYTDSTGAQYQMGSPISGIYTGKKAPYMWLDSTVSPMKIHFRDGTVWVMGCTSGGAEADAGTMYPTIIEDVSGNQVTIVYAAGAGLSSTNTSARISYIEDSRGSGGASYSFGYNSDIPVPHLSSTTDYIGTGASHSFTYNEAVAVEPPFGADPTFAGITTTQLATMTVPGVGPWLFTYDSAGASELLQATFPWGGHLRWTYGTDPYNGSRDLRVVSARYLAADSAGATEWSYGISRDNASSASQHTTMTLTDASGVGAKTWNFGTSGIPVGLVTEFVQSASAGGTVLQDDVYTWASDPTYKRYISAKSSTIGQGTSNVQTATSTQTLDQYGNVTQSVVYPYNNTTTPLKTFNNTYLSTSTYTSNYIFNRLVSSTVTPAGGSAITLVTNYYDGGDCTSAVSFSPPYQCGGWVNLASGPAYNIDPSPPIPLGQRGYLNWSVTPAKTTTIAVYSYGSPAFSWGSDGSVSSASADTSTNFNAPVTITSQSYTTTLAYNSWLGVTQTTGANGEQMAMSYDSFGRPGSGTSPYQSPYCYCGPTVSYSYGQGNTGGVTNASGAFWQMRNGPDGRTVTILDGLGRAIRVDRGTATAMQSSVQTNYAPCACSPLGKIQQTSQPFVFLSSATAWTTYTYDGLGRPVTVVQPDGHSTTRYFYSGNVTTVGDPTAVPIPPAPPTDSYTGGIWKQFTTDVEGNLVTVTEPDPANQPSGKLSTIYTYDWMKHVTGVSMSRAGTTQTRTFVYDSVGRLTSATNPEYGTFSNGTFSNNTVSYAYNIDNTLQMKTDGKSQQTVYTYDSLKRLTMTQYYPQGVGGSAGEDGCQRVTYSYDTNPYNSTFSQNSYGRLTAVLYGAAAGSFYAPGAFCTSSQMISGGLVTYFADMYSYHPAGGVTAKRLSMARGYSWNMSQANPFAAMNPPPSVEVDYTYDNAGRTATTTYPMAYGQQSPLQPQGSQPVTLTYGYDSMGRPTSLTDVSGYTGWGWGWPSGSPLNWAQNVQYDYAGRMSSEQLMIAPSYGNSGYVPAWTQETMSYNVNGQLTFMGWAYNPYGYGFGTPGGIQYNYSATQNNGQITQAVEGGAAISYQYDALKRLTSASSTAYTQTYQYDGFGNLTAKVLNGTSTPIPVNAATNRLSSASYDLNGNMTSGSGATMVYDEANRISSAAAVSGGIEYYGYSADNKRFYKYTSSGTEQLTFYGARGEKLGVYAIVNSFGYQIQPVSTNIWFAGKLIVESSEPAYIDRLGTNLTGFISEGYPYFYPGSERFYPYGDEITSTLNDHEKFATYTRDSYTGFDYADQRYYASTYGRFNTADPYQASGGPADPGSWNRYSYTRGDPVNRRDPKGLWDDNPAFLDSLEQSPDGEIGTGGGGVGCLGTYAFLGGPALIPPDWCNPPMEQPAKPSPPTCSISLYERSAGGSPGNHTYLDVSETQDGVTILNDVIEGNPINKSHPPFRNPISKGWPPMWGYIEPVFPGATFNGSTNPATNSLAETDTGANLCADISILFQWVNAYDSGTLARYMPIPGKGFYNSNAFTYTLLYDIGLENPNGSNVFPEPPGWNPGWGTLVPGLH